MQGFLALLMGSTVRASIMCVLLPLLHALCNRSPANCPAKPSVHHESDLVLEGFFPLHFLNLLPGEEHTHFLVKPHHGLPHEWKWEHYQYILAGLFAVEEINRNPHLLPNSTLGLGIYNALNNDHKTLENSLRWLSGGKQAIPNYNCQKEPKSVAVIAGNKPEFSTAIGSLLELYKVPQVTYGPFDSVLNDKDRFPSLYQMATKYNHLAQGVVSLLLHFGWTWVEIFVTEDTKGEQFLGELESEMVKEDICVAFIKTYPVFWKRFTEDNFLFPSWIKYSTANVSLLCGDAEIFTSLTYGYFISKKVWIMTAKWYTDHSPWKNTFHGSLVFSPPKKEIPGFQHFFKTMNSSKYSGDFYFGHLWCKLNCSLSVSLCGEVKDCLPNISSESIAKEMDLMTMSEPSLNIYNAVYALAHVLHEMLLLKTDIASAADIHQYLLLSWKLHPFLRDIQFTNCIGERISFDDNENLMEQYDILNHVEFPPSPAVMVKVGEFVTTGSNNGSMVINAEMIEWSALFTEIPPSVCSQKCVPGFKKVLQANVKCCFDCALCPKREISVEADSQQCIQCSDQEYPNNERTQCLPKVETFLAFEDIMGMVLVCTALSFSILTVGVLWVFVKHWNTPIVKANNRVLSYILLLSLLLCFLCSFLFLGRPNTATCILQQITFGLVFTVAVSSILAKTITVILAFKVTKSGRTVTWFLMSKASNSIILFCTLIQAIICGLWLGTSPPFVDTDLHSEARSIIIMCNKGSITAFYCMLGFLGSLALGSFSLSYLVRNLPDTFNEAKLLTFSMLVFCSVWVTFLPVYHSSKGKFMVATEVFSILVSSAGLLCCIFAPKCYIILIRPDKNSMKALRNKIDNRVNNHT